MLTNPSGKHALVYNGLLIPSHYVLMAFPRVLPGDSELPGVSSYENTNPMGSRLQF